MFFWQSAGRLRPMRMVWTESNYNEPLHEIEKLSRRRRLRANIWPLRPYPKVDDDREMRQQFPGETGSWPRNRKWKRLSKKGHHETK